MALLAGDLHDEAVCESDCWLLTEGNQSGPDNLPILQYQPIVLEQHFDSDGDPGRIEVVDGTQYPNRFGEHQMRNPCTWLDKRFGPFNLSRMFPDHKPDQNVGVNRAHASR